MPAMAGRPHRGDEVTTRDRPVGEARRGRGGAEGCRNRRYVRDLCGSAVGPFDVSLGFSKESNFETSMMGFAKWLCFQFPCSSFFFGGGS